MRAWNEAFLLVFLLLVGSWTAWGSAISIERSTPSDDVDSVEQVAGALQSRADLPHISELLKPIENNREFMVQTGGCQSKRLEYGRSKSFTLGTKDFYGCAIVILASNEGVVLGHFNKEHRECQVLQDPTLTRKEILDKEDGLMDKEMMFGFECADEEKKFGIVLTSASKNWPGSKLLHDALSADFPKLEWKPYKGPQNAAVIRDWDVPDQKAAVRWEADENQGKLSIYLESDTPIWENTFRKQ